MSEVAKSRSCHHMLSWRSLLTILGFPVPLLKQIHETLAAPWMKHYPRHLRRHCTGLDSLQMCCTAVSHSQRTSDWQSGRPRSISAGLSMLGARWVKLEQESDTRCRTSHFWCSGRQTGHFRWRLGQGYRCRKAKAEPGQLCHTERTCISMKPKTISTCGGVCVVGHS